MLWDAVWIIQKIKIELPYGPKILLLSICTNEKDILTGKIISTILRFIELLFIIAKVWK